MPADDVNNPSFLQGLYLQQQRDDDIQSPPESSLSATASMVTPEGQVIHSGTFNLEPYYGYHTRNPNLTW